MGEEKLVPNGNEEYNQVNTLTVRVHRFFSTTDTVVSV